MGIKINEPFFVFLLTRYMSDIEPISGDFPLYPFLNDYLRFPLDE